MASEHKKEERTSREVLDSRLVRLLDKDDILPLDLYTGALIGDYQVVRDLIAAGVDINRPNYSGWTALIYSAYVGKDTIVNLLLEAGVVVDATVPSTGMTAMMYAASCGYESVVYFLIQQGGKINAQDTRGRTSLFHSATRGHVIVAKILLEQGADMEIGDDENGNTPLMESAVEGYEVIFSLLLDHGANVDASNKVGETARSLAIRYGNTMIADLIDQRMKNHDLESLRSEASLGDGGHRKFWNTSTAGDKCHDTAYILKEAWGNPPAFQSYPPRVNVASPSYGEMEMINTEAEMGPLRSRDMVAPIDLSDHEQGASSFRSLRSEYDTLTFSSHQDRQENSFFDKGELPNTREIPNERREFLNSEKGRQTETHERFVPKQNKPSRVGTEPPSNVHTFDGYGESQTTTLHDLLQEMHLSKYWHCFEQRGIDLKSFLTLTYDDLKEIGVDKFGPRKKMLSTIQRFNNDPKTIKEFQANRHQQEQGQGLERGSQLQRESGQGLDLASQLQQANSVIKQLESQLYKEQLARAEMEAYFVSEQGRITRVMHLAVETKRDCENALKTLSSARALQADVSERLNNLKDENRLEDTFPVKESQKNILDVQRSLEGQFVSLNTNLTVASKQVDQILEILQ